MRRQTPVHTTLGSIMALAVVLAATGVSQAGTLAYPALGNFDARRGTVEMWIIPQFDPLGEELLARPFWGSSLFELRQDESTYFNLIWRIMRNRSGPFSRHRNEGHPFPTNWYTESGWQKGQPRHIAYCWEPGRDWWVIDGVKMEPQRQQRMWDFHVNETLEIVIGASGGEGRFVIDDLRISSRPRTEEEVGYHAPGRLRSDPWTLLLDTFDEPFECDGVEQTRPHVMTPSLDGSRRGGLPSPKTEFAPGVADGTGLQL